MPGENYKIMKRTFCFKAAALLCFTITAVSSQCAESGFDGCWDITVPKEPHGRAWWLKIEGADIRKPSGDFISAFEHFIALEARRHQVDGIVCGHIHHAEIRMMRVFPADY